MTAAEVPGTEIYRKLILLMIHSKRGMYDVLEEFNMTPVQGTMLMLFEPGVDLSMHCLSELMGCDASNITGLVDRLDAQDLIERTTNPDDRRKKMVRLSEKGEHCRRQVLLSLKKAEAADLNRLTRSEQTTFIRLIDKLTAQK